MAGNGVDLVSSVIGEPVQHPAGQIRSIIMETFLGSKPGI